MIWMRKKLTDSGVLSDMDHVPVMKSFVVHFGIFIKIEVHEALVPLCPT